MQSTLSGDPTPEEVNEALDQIAEARGIPREQIEQDYEQFKQLKAQADDYAILNGGQPSPNLNQDWHPSFMGSESQLQTGKVIGDALGIDPVFGSLLNPTGGLVGPENYGISVGEDYGVGRHGIVHDAGGYLLNYHDIGPGYNYLGLEDNRSPHNRNTGQESGIEFWNNKSEEIYPIKTVTESVGELLGDIVDVSEFFAHDTIDHQVDATYDAYDTEISSSNYNKYSNN